MIDKEIYNYLSGPIGLDEKTRVKLCWWAFLRSGCEAVKTIKKAAGRQLHGAVVYVQLTRASPKITY